MWRSTNETRESEHKIERFTITFTANDKREIVQSDQVFCLLVVCKSLFLHGNKLFLVMVIYMYQIYFVQFLSAHFLIWEILNLDLTFAICRKRDSNSLQCEGFLIGHTLSPKKTSNSGLQRTELFRYEVFWKKLRVFWLYAHHSPYPYPPEEVLNFLQYFHPIPARLAQLTSREILSHFYHVTKFSLVVYCSLPPHKY